MKSILDITKRERLVPTYRYGDDIAIEHDQEFSTFILSVGLNIQHYKTKAEALDALLAMDLPKEWYYP